MKDKLEKIIKHIVEHKDMASIEEVEGKAVNTLVLRIAGEDYGRIVGSKGRTINMIQNLVDAYSDIPTAPHKYRLILDDAQTQSWGKRVDFEVDPNWNPDSILGDLREFIGLFGKIDLSVVDVGSHVIFECRQLENNYMNESVNSTIEFLTIAMCKGYGRNAMVDFYV